MHTVFYTKNINRSFNVRFEQEKKRLIPQIARMTKTNSDSYLIAILDVDQGLVIADLVHISEPLQVIGRLDPNKRLREWHRTKPPVKEEETFARIDPEEISHVQIVGEGSREPHYPDHPLTRLNLRERGQL